MKRIIAGLLVVLVIAGCGGKGADPNPGGTKSPSAVILTAPAQNAVCTTGTIISGTQSSIKFTWGAAANTDSYDINIKNLLTATITNQNTTDTKLTVTLLRNTPYSWYIVSKSTKTSVTAQSDVWKFYNSGPGVVTYAPYPAEITSPKFGQSVTAATINLTWKGSAVDNATITNYDVYFGTATNPAIFKTAVTDSFVNNLSVTSKTTYYWKVITRDINGNTSDSGLYQFSVK